jgi:nucleotide-binding universal stress UspA family protein/RimJ/RimL family protein N-acetyltransferase
VDDAAVPIRLPDGARIEIRPIEPADRDELRRGFDRLSPASRYRRFFGPMTELSGRELDYLTQVDHRDHEALVAFDAETRTGIGVARFVRTAPGVAEPAVVVVDDWQGRGVGTQLVRALAARALEEGVTRFEAPVLANNPEALRMFEQLGETTARRTGREVQLSIELPREHVPIPDWHAVVRQFASGLLEPARTVLERLWPRRPGAPQDERFNVIVVGADGTEESTPALDTAAELALHSGARVEVVGVHRFLSGEQPALEGALEGAAQAMRERGITAAAQTRRGDPALVLTDFAAEQQARLIVVGSGGHGPTRRRLLGSVADLVAERSPCDVLIVRPRKT